MALFSYSAYTTGGVRDDGEVDARTAAEAAAQLAQRGLLAFRVVAVDASTSRVVAARFRRGTALSLSEYAVFARQLATLLQAELPLDQCLRLVASQNARGRIASLAERLAEGVNSGRSLSDALDREPLHALPFITPLVRAGEARGTLTPCLIDLAHILERRVDIRQRLLGALVYPTILLFVALLTVGLVVGVLVPTLMPLFKDTGAAAPLVLQLAEDMSRMIAEHWRASLAGLGASGVAIILLTRNPAFVAAWERLLLLLPGFGTLMRRTNIALIARTLGSLVRNGVPLVSALGLAAPAASLALFRSSLEASAQTVKEGGKLTAALQQGGAFPDLALRFIAIGEESSRLDEMLFHLADVFDADLHRQIERMLTLLTPAITLFVGVFVGGLILSVMQAVLSVNDIAVQ